MLLYQVNVTQKGIKQQSSVSFCPENPSLTTKECRLEIDTRNMRYYLQGEEVYS